MTANPKINISRQHIREQAQEIAYILDTYNGFGQDLRQEEMDWFTGAFSDYEEFYLQDQDFIYSAEKNIHLRIKMGLENVSTDGNVVSAQATVTNVLVTSNPYPLEGVDYNAIQGKINRALKLV